MNNQEVVRRFYGAFNDRNERIIDEVIAEDYTDFGHNPPGRGIQGAKEDFKGLIKAFNPIQFNIDEIFSLDDRVIARWTARGTHSGPFAGIAATNKQTTLRGMSIYRLRDGKIIETRNSVDFFLPLMELGVIEFPKAA